MRGTLPKPNACCSHDVQRQASGARVSRVACILLLGTALVLSELPDSSIPACGVLWKTRALNSYDAKSLSSGSLHHHPAFQAINHLCSERFEACYLSGNVVGFDINVNAALMVDALDLDDGFVGRCC